MKVSCDPETSRAPPSSEAKADTAMICPSRVPCGFMQLKSMTSMLGLAVATAMKPPTTTTSRTAEC